MQSLAIKAKEFYLEQKELGFPSCGVKLAATAVASRSKYR